jgi:hypothetical protein
MVEKLYEPRPGAVFVYWNDGGIYTPEGEISASTDALDSLTNDIIGKPSVCGLCPERSTSDWCGGCLGNGVYVAEKFVPALLIRAAAAPDGETS